MSFSSPAITRVKRVPRNLHRARDADAELERRIRNVLAREERVAPVRIDDRRVLEPVPEFAEVIVQRQGLRGRFAHPALDGLVVLGDLIA